MEFINHPPFSRLPGLKAWAIGPTIGINYAYLVHTDGEATCPENVVTGETTSTSWFYLNKANVWKRDDSSITLTCVT